MFCGKCGNQIAEGGICPNCGFDSRSIQNMNASDLGRNSYPKNKTGVGKTVGIIITSVVLLVGLGIFGYMFFFGSLKDKRDTEKLIDMIKQREFEDAYDYYNKELSGNTSSTLKNEIKKSVSPQYDEIIEEYNNGSLNETQMEDLIEIFNDIGLNDESYYSFVVNYERMNASKYGYSMGMKCYDDENYAEAIKWLVKVLSTDTNYNSANKMLKDAIEKMMENSSDYLDVLDILDENKSSLGNEEYNKIKQNVTDTIVSIARDEVDKYIKNGNYSAAESYIDRLISKYGDISELSQIKQEIKGDVVESLDTIIKQYFKENDYVGAKAYLQDLLKQYADNSEIKSKLNSLETSYIAYVKEQAESYAKSKDYGKAASAVNAAISQLGEDNTELNELYNEYRSYLGMYIDEMETLTQSKSNSLKKNELKDNAGNTYSHSLRLIEYNQWSDNIPEAQYLLQGKYNSFMGTFALLEDDKNTKHSYYYEVYGDEKLLYTSPSFSAGSLPVDFTIDISGVNILKIKAYCLRDGSLSGYNEGLIIADGILNRAD